MKIFKKDFISEIAGEAEAAVHVERYLSVDYILKTANVKTPKILSYDLTSITLEYIDLPHTKTAPNFDKFHNSTTDYYRKFNIDKAEYRLQFIDNLEYNTTEKHRLKNIALENIDWVIKNEPFVFLHMDAIYKNYFSNGKKTVWIDFQDAMMGPKSYDEVHFLIDCFAKEYFDVKNFNVFQQKSALYNSIRQHGIFCAIPRFKHFYEDVTKYNINKVLKELGYDLEIT
jgi:aminoglycoside/choline kinase family phosphotransferase